MAYWSAMVALCDLSLRVNAAGDVVLPAGSRLNTRRIKDHELVWIITGSPRWCYEGVEREAPPGSLLFIKPGLAHSFDWGKPGSCHHRYVHFDIPETSGVRPAWRRWPSQMQLTPDTCACHCFEEAMRLTLQRPAGWHPLAVNAIRQVLLTLVGGEVRTVAQEQVLPTVVERVLVALEEEWSRGLIHPHGLDSLSRLAGVSRSQLCRVFQASLGMSPVQCIKRMRLIWAAVLLVRTSDSVSEVAERTGFIDVPGFSKNFKAFVGQTPGAFRRQGSQRHRLFRLDGNALGANLARELLKWVREGQRT